MRTRLVAVLLAVLTVAGFLAVERVNASPAEEYTGTHFGAGNLPPGCEADSLVNYTDNVCYHQRTGMNGLDDPKVDVVILIPATPDAERDARIMRQAVEMWDGGIQNLGPQMGLNWLSTGMRFNIHVAVLDVANSEGFNPYPIADPDIVVVATTNPFGGLGIGIDPVVSAGDLIKVIDPTLPFADGNVPCTGLSNPFDMDAWQSVPGFDAHHGDTSGTYTQDCPGSGGNICFAVNTALDPAPDTIEITSLFDMVAHEFGHCLTIGHVGDGAEGPWGKVPTNDIMSYNADPVGLNKCVSTLDVEGIAISMSHYIDTDGDGEVTNADQLDANDPAGDGTDAFQTQHPRDHFYASGTGKPRDCPQPDLGIIPGGRTNWQPAPVSTAHNVLTVNSPTNNATTPNGNVNVTGVVEHQVVSNNDPDPTSTSASFDDADDDATTPITEITSFDAHTTADTVEATIALASLPPQGDAAPSPTTYSVHVDGRRFDSFVLTTGAELWDNDAGAYLDTGGATWDAATNTVNFHIPRSYLVNNGITAPYQLRAEAQLGNVTLTSVDDSAPEDHATIGIKAPAAGSARFSTIHVPLVGASAQTVTFENHDTSNGNTFYPEDSTLGVKEEAGLDNSHMYTLNLPQRSDVKFTLEWTDAVGNSDLDLRATHNGVENADGATGAKPEIINLTDVVGNVDLVVTPYLVTDELEGSTYTLTAEITPSGVVLTDRDHDGVPDASDVCPDEAGAGANGCPIAATEEVRVLVDGVAKGHTDVDTSNGPDQFSVPVTIGAGTHKLRIEWLRFGKVAASETRSVTFGTPTSDPVVTPKLTIDDATTTEGKKGDKPMAFAVHLDRAAKTDLVLKLTTTNGTAKSPDDFAGGTTTFVIKAGRTTATALVTVHGDATAEPTESFSVKVTGNGVSYVDATATGTITDDDQGLCIDLGNGPLGCVGLQSLAEVPLP